MFRKTLEQDYATVANNSLYVVFAALAYSFAGYGNRYSLDARLGRRGAAAG